MLSFKRRRRRPGKKKLLLKFHKAGTWVELRTENRPSKVCSSIAAMGMPCAFLARWAVGSTSSEMQSLISKDRPANSCGLLRETTWTSLVVFGIETYAKVFSFCFGCHLRGLWCRLMSFSNWKKIILLLVISVARKNKYTFSIFKQWKRVIFLFDQIHTFLEKWIK